MKNFLSKLLSILGVGINYGTLVNQAVKQVETETEGHKLDGASKQQIALTYVLAAAHAGEAIPVPTVQLVAGLIDAAVSTLNAMGVFKKATPAA